MGAGDEMNFFNSVLESVIAIDKEGKIQEVNSVTLKLLGYKKKEDLIMVSMEKICRNLPLGAQKNRVPLQEQELLYSGKGKKEIPVSVNIIRSSQYPGGIIFMARDIRKTKGLIGKLTRSQDELKKSYAEISDRKNELVRSEKLAYTGRIAAGIAHEIRNPLTNVTMSLQQLKKRTSAHEHVEIIEKNTERINFLITELLNCARPPKLNLRNYAIHVVLKDVLESAKAKIKAQRVKVIKRYTSKLSKIKVDKEQIERAFLNIILNAVEAMPKGGRLIISTEFDGNFLMTKIQDTGRGISDENIIRVFDPFFSTKYKGVGLGLTVCYGIVLSHGGTIEVESKWKKGSIFTISLPIR